MIALACLLHAAVYLHQRFFQTASQGSDYFTQRTESLAQEVLRVETYEKAGYEFQREKSNMMFSIFIHLSNIVKGSNFTKSKKMPTVTFSCFQTFFKTLYATAKD